MSTVLFLHIFSQYLLFSYFRLSLVLALPQLSARVSGLARSSPAKGERTIALATLLYQGLEYNYLRSNIFLSRFIGWPEFLFYLSLKNKLLRHGQGERSLVIFTNFLFFLKILYQLDPIYFVKRMFLNGARLPFRLYTLKSSNRTYTFPGPILTEYEYQNILIKNFGHALRRRKEPGFLNKFFFELSYFLDQNQSSELVVLLQQMQQTGFENRAFLHYRWRIKR